eukprot:CAMPEP_0117012958 /NCGR_PEP_ID=MMETSP0472-20121206/10781_1 /TAXON_ID=693140 ORGANISM="Tiarina fusus, Strain LIS" /NCGR_SAMPLE_ID=MMETSP0472 /ASSEMBLY_ACC=CAM_ASM_000603 /LENGTH=537 /DNA_ID=CAMNT_0004716133 /DNA_START=102 /DNA_END=1712 /DNA_ORIENTATION=+
MSGEYGVAMGVKRGKCQEDACNNCPRYLAADDDGEGGGPCMNCGHFPALHENLGPDETEEGAAAIMEDEKIFYEDPDPLGLLQEPGNSETTEEIEARKQLQDLCEWSIAGNELRFLERLGSGRSAKVYKGLYKNQEVAIKVLKPILDPKELQNFKSELDIMSSVDSNHVVKFFGGCLQPKICLVMEYCSNGSLYHLFQRKELKFDWPLLFRLCVETVEGVLALHNHHPQVVHRDLKSLNLLVNKEYSVKVCDFGLSRVIQGSQDESTLGKLRGTYAYSAPEVYKGEKYTDKSDVFSIGVILWEAIARIFTNEYQRPYKEYNYKIDFQIIINSAKHGKRPRLGLDICPENLKNLITQCWDPAPDVRPRTAEVLERLKEIQAEYEANSCEWDLLIGKLCAEKKQEPVVEPAPKPEKIEQPTAAPETKWSHKTIDDFLSGNMDTPPNGTNNQTPEIAMRQNGGVKDKSKRASLTRGASKKLLSRVGRGSEDKLNNTTPDATDTASIERTSGWTHTGATVDWRAEDDFGDDTDNDNKKKKW